MFNNSISPLKNISLLLGAFLILFSCKKDSPLTFHEQNIETSENAIVDITYPKAEGMEDIADKINATIENFLANEINLTESPDQNLTLEKAMKGFDNEYKEFQEDFSDSMQIWEVLIESEVIYESENIVCISVSSYLDTGGAHGNSRVTFLNFDKNTGQRLEQQDILKDIAEFKKLVQPYFKKATKSLSDEETIQDPFYGEGFQLPENIGYSEVGIILLYNVYEIASYAQGVTEFIIPYEAAKPYLKLY